MKKKRVEKVPYMTIPEGGREEDVKYIGAAAVRDIAGVEHLFLEVYKNSVETLDVPQVRIVLTKKDFGNFFPDTGEWSREKICSGGRLLWDAAGNGYAWMQMNIAVRENVLMGEEDLDRIRRYCGVRTEYRRWWEYISDHEDRTARDERRRAESRRYERRRQALEERISCTPRLPEQEILDRADEVLFNREHHLYYKKHGSRVRTACTKCGGTAEARWKSGESYESSLERCIEEPREGHPGCCLLCGAAGIYKCQGRYSGKRSRRAYIFLGQKYKETGMVIRYIQIEKYWDLVLAAGEKGPEMYGARERLEGVETARAYFLPGRKTQIDYQKHDPYTGADFWDDCNLYGNANITIRSAPVMAETYDEMKGTMFQYSALQEYVKAAGDTDVVSYLDRYRETPQIEMLVKLGLTETVGELIRYHCGITADPKADRIDAFLGIRKERVGQLAGHKGDIGILTVIQMEKRLGQKWSAEQIEQITELDIGCGYQFLEYMGIQKFLNRVERYAGCGYGTMCSAAAGRLRRTAQIYTDYLAMRRELGYDMHNTVFLFPRDLEAAHEKMTAEQNRQKADARVRDANERYPMIKEGYRRLWEKFYFEDDDFMIRPAMDAGEIVMEGRVLHHCVGGKRYLERHDTGESIILFLRSREEPDMPYITVEIDPREKRIRQWHGAGDKQPDEERMQRWLDVYVTRLRCGAVGTPQAAAGEETGQRLPAYA